MHPSLLTLTDIRKSFGGVRALERACLELRRGAVTALIGENGAGKSTLVKILSGIYQPDAGEIRFDGSCGAHRHSASARALGIGVVHQECLAFDNLSVAENLFVNCAADAGRPRELGGSCARGRRRYCASWAPTSTPTCLPAA